MHLGSDALINAQILIILLLSCWASISSANILTDVPKNNPLDIDWYPAPSPEDGPPLSAGASRDPSLLPAQIGGIVGAYVFSVCVIGIALILIGRRLRHVVQRSTRALDIEMLQPQYPKLETDISPTTPGTAKGPRNFSWPSPEKTDHHPYIFPSNDKQQRSPGLEDPYVDRRIVEADREMLHRDLEDLYAHVMEQEDAKAAGVDLKEMPLPPQLQNVGRVPQSGLQRQPTPPKKLGKSKPASIEIEEPTKSPKLLHSRSSSILSSLKSPKKKGVREMVISSPIPTPLSSTFPAAQAPEDEPLSPRYYTPPPPPPVPKDQAPYTHTRNGSTGVTVSPTRSIAEQLSHENFNANRSITHFHRPNQSQTSVQSSASRGDPVSATSATSQTPLYPTASAQAPALSSSQTQLQPPPSRHAAHPHPTASNPPSNNSSVRALPLRQFEPALASPSLSHTTKTTVLERTSPLSPGLNTSGQPRTPWSAGAVPYSPYQPFTPIMPITPRLVTKEDRKRARKKEGRTPVLEMIKSDDELFDSGY